VPGKETGLRLRTIGYRVNRIGIEKLSLQDLYPLGYARPNASESKLQFVFAIMSAARSRQVCSSTGPPDRRGTGLRQKDDGGRAVGSNKIIAAGPLPPARRRGTGLRAKDDGGVNCAGDECDSYQRTMGVGQSLSTSIEKIMSPRPIPPRAARNGSISKKTMGG
jgi:hypothetical protein